MKISTDKIAYHEGSFKTLENCTINIATHALQYGTMVIGGIRGYYNSETQKLHIFRLQDHVKRLARSAHIMQMSLPKTGKEIEDLIIELVRLNNAKTNVYLRPFIYKSSIQLSPRLHDVEDSFSIYLIHLDDYLDTSRGMRLGVSSWRRIDENSVPARVKSSGSYINSALAKSEAIQNNFDEAIFLDTRGFVSEGSAENIFIVRDEVLITPPQTASVLEGITRLSLIEIAKDLGIKTVERDIARGELYIADEVFLCGTGAQVAWVSEIDHRKISNGSVGKITSQLKQAYLDIVMGRNSKYLKWLTLV